MDGNIKKDITKLFKHYQIKRGCYISGNNIYNYKKCIMGDKLSLVDLKYFDLIKLNGYCNYYTFRRHIHDLKSHINGIYGMLSILSFEHMDEEENDDTLYFKELTTMMDNLIKFSSVEVNNKEKHFMKLEKHSVYNLIIFYISGICDTFIVDKQLDIIVNSVGNIVKHIMDVIDKIKDNDLLFEYRNNQLLIRLLENGNNIAFIKLETPK